MRPPRSKYNGKHPTWFLGSKRDGNILCFHVEHDEALNEIGIHLFGDPELNSAEFSDAWELAERDNFPRIFIHKLPTNVISFEAFRAKRSA